MMDYGKCRTCGEFGWPSTHKCNPEWDVEVPGWGVVAVRAYDAEEAAEKGIEKYDRVSCDYLCVGGHSFVVAVRPHDSDDEPQYYTVTGESVPQYSAYASLACDIPKGGKVAT